MQLKDKIPYDTRMMFYDRLDVASDIAINVKDDLKILMQRNEEAGNIDLALLYAFLAHKAVNTVIELSKLKTTILLAEETLTNESSTEL